MSNPMGNEMGDEPQIPPDTSVTTIAELPVPAAAAVEFQLVRERHDQEIEDRKSRRSLRGKVAIGAGLILVLELVIVCLIILGAGLGWLKLSDWVIGTFINGVIVQHYFVIRIIVSNLFPRSDLLGENARQTD
jgi:hypothetical protein